jgi:hypothetical protein
MYASRRAVLVADLAEGPGALAAARVFAPGLPTLLAAEPSATAEAARVLPASASRLLGHATDTNPSVLMSWLLAQGSAGHEVWGVLPPRPDGDLDFGASGSPMLSFVASARAIVVAPAADPASMSRALTSVKRLLSAGAPASLLGVVVQSESDADSTAAFAELSVFTQVVPVHREAGVEDATTYKQSVSFHAVGEACRSVVAWLDGGAQVVRPIEVPVEVPVQHGPAGSASDEGVLVPPTV